MFNIRQEKLFSLEEILETSPRESYPLILESLDIAPLLKVVSKKALLGAPTRLNYSAMIYSLIIRIIERQPSLKTHSHYDRSFQDLPMQNKKVMVILSNRKMFCHNPECEHTTFAETFDFLPAKAKRTKRLEDEIINLSMNVSSLTASSLLTTSVAKVGKSTICNLLKKRYTDH